CARVLGYNNKYEVTRGRLDYW
nr:immunoglobulin heavy chain junction region [Macaca mulatta]MOX64886.1 immunoglobulin heavy chain junction region [Macaca mulatta]MOX66118.1 immunoglobulin heavy chain junction region [Macaca mulatta]